jgi:hypothetical protein
MATPRFPAVRRGRAIVLPLETLEGLRFYGDTPCKEGVDVIRHLADESGDIPLTKATLRKALKAGADFDWLADALAVDTSDADFHLHACDAALKAYNAAIADAVLDYLAGR